MSYHSLESNDKKLDDLFPKYADGNSFMTAMDILRVSDEAREAKEEA